MQPSISGEAKIAVRDFWQAGSCGDAYARGESLRERLEAQAKARYELEPFIAELARFEEGAGKDILEIGVGMGADHLLWAQSGPRSLTGLDLTLRAVEWTRARLEQYGLEANVQQGDAENLPFEDNAFDIVYSWGVLHHTPDTPRAIREVHRVLRPGGSARIMVYHRDSLVGRMLWLRYALLRGRPNRNLDDIYATHLESPGTKAFTLDGARRLLADFSRIDLSVRLSGGDLLEGVSGQRHRGPLLSAVRRLWPRSLIRRHLASKGLFLLIDATK